MDASVEPVGRATWMSWHGDNAQPAPRKGLSGEEKQLIKMDSFRAVSDFVARLDGPVLLAADINSWRDPVELLPADPGDPYYEEHRFVGPDPRHGLRDAWRLLLGRTGRLDSLREERPDGPLAVSYNGGRSGHRFDRVWMSHHLVPTAGGYDLPGGQAAGSDHAIVWLQIARRED